MSEAANGVQHSIKLVSRITGLSPHVIRTWEKRYGAVTPARTDTKRRVYSEAEVERLCLLRQATERGHNIGAIAHLSTDQLRQLVCRTGGPDASSNGADAGPRELVEQALCAIRNLDSHSLENTLGRAVVSLGAQGLLIRVVAPLAQRVGELWQEGSITAAHEHFASAVLRAFLSTIARPYAQSDHAPRLVVATPAGQLHELGALMVASAASNYGWRSTYLGASLPAAEIASAATQNHARAVALSIVYPTNDPHLPFELEMLRRYLPGEVAILAGGRAVSAYRGALERVGAQICPSLKELDRLLEALISPARS